MNNSVFGKTLQNVQIYRDIMLIANDRRHYVVSQPNNCSRKWFSKNIYC